MIAESVTELHNDNSKCVILVPVGGSIEPKCEEGLRELERRGYPVWRIRGYAAIDQARCQMATDAMNQGFAETMWIDSDIAFFPDDIERLRSHQLPLCCGVYPKKGLREIACCVLPGTTRIKFGKGAELMEVMYAATGFLHVRRPVYRTIREQLSLPVCNLRFGSPLLPYFQPFVKTDEQGAWYLAEDFAFCERARQCGFKIIADPAIRLGHVGSYTYSWEDAGTTLSRFDGFEFNLA